jgi:hypothetical protein
MLTYNELIQEELSTLNDYQKSFDIILKYGSIYKRLDEKSILINQKELLTFPLWNQNSSFTPDTSSVTISVDGPDLTFTGKQFKYGFTSEDAGTQYFGVHPYEKIYFLSQSFGYVLDIDTYDFDTKHENILFYYGYANYDGSGSQLNSIAGGAPSEILNSTPSKILYRAIRNQFTENDQKIKLQDYTEINDFFYIKIPRQIYREELLKKSFELTLANSNGAVLTVTDDAVTNFTKVNDSQFVSVVSGTLNTYYTSSNLAGSNLYSNKIIYGILDTKNGYILLHAKKIADYFTEMGGGMGYVTTGNTTVTQEYRYTGNTENTTFNFYANLRGFTNILYSGSIASPFTLSGLETYTYDAYYIEVGASEFNRSTNPTYLTGSANNTFKPIYLKEDFVYITTIGLYNDDGDLLAVAKLSRPVLKKRDDVKLFKINISI